MCLIATSASGVCPGEETKGSWITFLSTRSGNTLLYKMKPDGSHVTPIFGGPIVGAAGVPEGVIHYRQPHFGYQSPNGKYFLDWAVDQSTSGEKILSSVKMLHLGRLDGGTTQIIAAEDVTEAFAWAPDSKHFVYEKTNQVMSITGRSIFTPKQIIIRTIDTKVDSVDELALEKPYTWAVQDWSPDGEKLLFASGLKIGRTASDTETNTSLVEFDLERARQMRSKLPGGGQFLYDEKRMMDEVNVTNQRMHFRAGMGV